MLCSQCLKNKNKSNTRMKKLAAAVSSSKDSGQTGIHVQGSIPAEWLSQCSGISADTWTG